MGEYKVVFRAAVHEPPNSSLVTWEPLCPLVIEAIQVSRHTETAQTYLQGKVRNVSASEVSSFRVIVTVVYEDGPEEKVELNPLDADIAPGALYELTPTLLERSDVIEARGKIEQVKTSHTTWITSAEPVSLPAAVPLQLSEKAHQERTRLYMQQARRSKTGLSPVIEARVAAFSSDLADAQKKTRHDINDHDEWWVCPCGQLNIAHVNCLSCGDPRAIWAQIPSDNEELEKIADERIQKEEAEKAARKEKIDAVVSKAKHGGLKFLKIGVPIIVGVLIIILALVFWIIPAVKYQNANSLAEAAHTNEEYQAAYDAFAALGDQDDAPQRLVDLAIQAGQAAEAGGDYETAVAWYDLAGSPELSNAAKYAYVQANQDGKNETTLAYLRDLVDEEYQDSAEMYESLFGWSFEFAMVSHKDYSNKGSVWTQSASVLPSSAGSDSPGLLIMPKGGAPGSNVELKVSTEKIKARKMYGASGKWETPNSKNITFSWSNGELWAQDSSAKSLLENGFVYVSLGNNMYDEAWRVTVTDVKTKEVLYTGEIHCS